MDESCLKISILLQPRSRLCLRKEKEEDGRTNRPLFRESPRLERNASAELTAASGDRDASPQGCFVDLPEISSAK